MQDWHYIPGEQNPYNLCTSYKLLQKEWFYGSETMRQKKLDLKAVNIKT